MESRSQAVTPVEPFTDDELKKLKTARKTQQKAQQRLANKLKGGKKEKVYRTKIHTDLSTTDKAREQVLQQRRNKKRHDASIAKREQLRLQILAEFGTNGTVEVEVLQKSTACLPLPSSSQNTETDPIAIHKEKRIVINIDVDEETSESLSPQPVRRSGRAFRSTKRQALTSISAHVPCPTLSAQHRTKKLSTHPPPIPTARLRKVMAKHHGGNNDVITTVDSAIGDVLTRNDFLALRPGVYVNDAIISAYFRLLRGRAASVFMVTSHICPTLLYTQLTDGGYSFDRVDVWNDTCLGKLDFTEIYVVVKNASTDNYLKRSDFSFMFIIDGDIFQLEKVFIPINRTLQHWLLAVVFMKERRVQLFDSLGDKKDYHAAQLAAIQKFLCDQYARSHAGDLLPNQDEWRYGHTTGELCCPLQNETSMDCGIFVCLLVDFLQLGHPIAFRQEDILKHGREWIGTSILENRILF